MWGSRTSQARILDRRYRRIRTCLPGEVESSSSSIRRQGAPNERYPSGMRDSRSGGMRDSRLGGMRDSRPSGMRDSRSGGMRNFPSGWNEEEFPSE